MKVQNRTSLEQDWPSSQGKKIIWRRDGEQVNVVEIQIQLIQSMIVRICHTVAATKLAGEGK